MKTLLLAFVLIAVFSPSQTTKTARALDSEERVSNTYDRFSDRTSVNVRVLALSQPRVYLVLFNSGKGKRFVSKSVGIALVNTEDTLWKFRHQDKTLFLIIDGERLEIPITKGISGSGQGDLSIETLDRIVAAKQVEGKYADVEFELSSAQMKLVREFRALLVTE